MCSFPIAVLIVAIFYNKVFWDEFAKLIVRPRTSPIVISYEQIWCQYIFDLTAIELSDSFTQYFFWYVIFTIKILILNMQHINLNYANQEIPLFFCYSKHFTESTSKLLNYSYQSNMFYNFSRKIYLLINLKVTVI